MPVNVEWLELGGLSAIDGTGNALANELWGNAAANVLNGGIGVDTMHGGAGDDTYDVDSASDVVDEAAKIGVSAIIQPGGSIRDNESIQAADEHGMTMVFTGTRHFKH